MIFGEWLVTDCEGARLVHSIRSKGISFRKGRLLTAADVESLQQAGIERVTVVRFESGDVGEDEAAERIARATAGSHLDVAQPFTGRCNLIAATHGLAVIDRVCIDTLNLVDESVTIATLPPFEAVQPGDMVATVKIMPFAISGALLERALAALPKTPPLRIAPFRARLVALIQTRLPGIKESVLDKTVDIINGRLAAMSVPPLVERRCAHEAATVTDAIRAALQSGAELVLIAGASAITDRRDVLPAGIEAAGGTVEHFGMPVDPGNLLLLARHGAVPVLGLPGCVRSPKLNGFDWVLQRLMADLPVTPRDIMQMGVGGLLKEIPSRPQPRAERPAIAPRAPRVAAIVLAAGRSTRMGGANKLLAELDGKPLLLHAVDAALTSRVRPVVVVAGNEADRVRAILAGRAVKLVDNPDFAAGLSASLACGLRALPEDVDGAAVLLGDMPRIGPATIDRLIAAFNPTEGRAICVPTFGGKRGNPVLWARRFFAEIEALAGDVGAKHLIGDYADLVAEVAMPDDAVLVDIDTPEALAIAREPGRRPA
ncbi:MAG: molybdopterin-binding/glycosyltransferase family 2 protein [Dongiaceae bacterium]